MSPAPAVVFLPAAERDIDAIADYIANDNLDAALRFYEAVRSDARNLAEMPGMGPVWGFRNSAYADVRFWPIRGFRNHLIFYRPAPAGIEVVRVIHGARDLERQIQRPT
jgi:toxin ParE1/3/4